VNTSSGPESKDQGHRLKVPSPGRCFTTTRDEVLMRVLTVVWIAVTGVLGSNVQVSIAAAAAIIYLIVLYRDLPPRKAARS
jgi:hypothetical protein